MKKVLIILVLGLSLLGGFLQANNTHQSSADEISKQDLPDQH